jgi:repressor LexA
MLTHQQRNLLTFICAYIDRKKLAPSHDEMKDALGLASKSGVNRILQGLIERGFIRSIPYRVRALEVLRRPDDKPAELILTENELKAVGYLRTHKDVMAQILERCQP